MRALMKILLCAKDFWQSPDVARTTVAFFGSLRGEKFHLSENLNADILGVHTQIFLKTRFVIVGL